LDEDELVPPKTENMAWLPQSSMKSAETSTNVRAVGGSSKETMGKEFNGLKIMVKIF